MAGPSLLEASHGVQSRDEPTQSALVTFLALGSPAEDQCHFRHLPRGSRYNSMKEKHLPTALVQRHQLSRPATVNT